MTGVIPEPTAAVGVKLASIAVHAQEAVSSSGHHFDIAAIKGLLEDPEVAEYLDALRALALLPVPR